MGMLTEFCVGSGKKDRSKISSVTPGGVDQSAKAAAEAGRTIAVVAVVVAVFSDPFGSLAYAVRYCFFVL